MLRAHHCYDNGALLSLSKLRKRTSQTFSLVLPPFVDEEVLKYLAERCRVRKDEEKLRVQRKREADAEERTRATWARTPGIIYNQIKSNRPAPSEIKRLKGGETANLEDIHQGMLEAWLPIFRKFAEQQEPSYEAFKARYGKFIPKFECKMESVSQIRLTNTIMRAKKGKCAGLDGWYESELAQLPGKSLDKLASLLNRVEVEGGWPTALLQAAIPMIPKEEQPTPLQHRPITVMSSVYRLWASMRAKQLQGWQEKWIGDSLHGFRPEHGAENAFMETAILIERALLTEVPIHGVLFDIRKCFDSIPWGIAFGLLRDMGMDERIVRPLQSMYCNLRRHMKVMGTAGEDFQATNGILQGCALSVVVLNAVVSVWDRAVREEARVMTNAYADDTKVMSEDAGRVREGVRLTEEFGELTGLRYAKTHAFSTAAREARPIITMYEQKLEMKDTFRDLGAEVSAV